MPRKWKLGSTTIELGELVRQPRFLAHEVDGLPDGPERRHGDELRGHPPAGGFLRIVEPALERDALRVGKAGENLLAVFLVEVGDDLDGVVGIELADGLGDLLVRDRFEDFAADGVVDLGQRQPVEVVAHEADELVALFRLERLQHAAEVGFVQVGDEVAERSAVMRLDGVRDALDELGADRALVVADRAAFVRLRSCGGLCFQEPVLPPAADGREDPLARGVSQEKAISA